MTENDDDSGLSFIESLDGEWHTELTQQQLQTFSQPTAPIIAHTSTISAPSLSLSIVATPHDGIAFQLWPAARVLCRYMDSQYHSRPWSSLQVCELGAGCGLVSMLAALYGAKVTVTDLPSVLTHIRANIDCNHPLFTAIARHDNDSDNGSGYEYECGRSGGMLRVAPLSWGEPLTAPHSATSYDMLLLSDCVYWESLFEPLLSTLLLLIRPEQSTTVWLAQSPRRQHVEARFFKLARKRFDVTVIGAMKADSSDRQNVSIYQMQQRPAAST